jgi:hypothetical protein
VTEVLSKAPAPSLAARLLGLAFLVALVALAIFSLGAQRADAGRVPGRDVAVTANAFITADFAAGDAVRVLPLWWEDGRVGLDGLPVLMQDPLDEWDRHRFSRMWLVYPDAYAGRAEVERAWLSDVETIFAGGGLTVERGTIVPGRPVLWDAFTAAQDAAVSRRNASDEERECTTWDGRAWYCGGHDEFIFVGRVIREMDDQYRECVSANPPPDRDTWEIEFSDVPAGEALDVRAGIALASARLPRGSEVLFKVFVDDELVFERAIAKEELGYPETRIPTPPDAETVTLRFEVSAADHLDRFFCFRAQTVGR